MAAFYSFYPPTSSAANPSIGTNGTTAPTSATEVAGINPSGNLQPLQTDAAGALITTSSATSVQHVIVDSSALPTGAATSANQTSGTQKTQIVDAVNAIAGPVQLIGTTNYLPVVLASSGTSATAAPVRTIQVGGVDGLGNLRTISTDASGNQNVAVVSSTLPTGASTSALQTSGNASLASIDTKTPALVAGAVPVTGPLTDTQLRATAVLVSLPSTTLTGTVTVVQPTGTNLHTVVDSSALPTGAATEATLSALNTKVTTTINGIKVDGSAVTQPISAAALPLPTGAATETTLSALNTKVPANLTVTATRLLVDASGTTQPVSGTVIVTQATAANLQATVTAAGKLSVGLARNDYSITPVTTAAYVQLVASTAAITNLLEIFDSSGQTLVLAIGAAAAEVDKFYINPGGNGQVPLAIPAGSRISIKAVTANATAGYINLNLYS